MGMRGTLNARGSQFLRGVAYVRHLGDEGSAGSPAGHVALRPDTDHVVGFTSGIPSTAATAGSGITVPAQGVYKAKAFVHVSGMAPVPAVVTQAGPQYGIGFTLDGAPIQQSRNIFNAASGVGSNGVAASSPQVTRLEAEATFFARKNDVLRVVIRGNGDAGGFTLVGQDELSGANVPMTVPAAFVHLQRIPTKELGSDTYLV